MARKAEVEALKRELEELKDAVRRLVASDLRVPITNAQAFAAAHDLIRLTKED